MALYKCFAYTYLPGGCGSVPADWTSAPPAVNYTRPTTAQPDTEHAHSDRAEYFRSRDYGYDARDFEYGDNELDASAYGVTSSARPEVHPLVVDIYAVSDTQRRSHVGYSWSRDGDRPMTSSDGYDDDYDDYDDYSDGTADRSRGHVTSYMGRPGSRGHESSLGQSGWREVDEAASDGNVLSSANRRHVVAMASVAAAATVTMVAVRRL